MTDAYGKRPLWHWIALYLVLAAIVYTAVYYLFLAPGSTSTSTANATAPGSVNNLAPPSTGTATESLSNSSVTPDNIITTRTDPAKGNYLADFSGMTLYTFDKDTNGTSNCTGTCAATWPPFTLDSLAPDQSLPAGLSVITRADGSQQYTWQGKPLYYYLNDKQAGDILGDGINGLWHLVPMP